MSTLIEDVGAVIATLAPAGGVWYSVNTQESPQYPYIVYQRISSTANVSLLGASDMQNTRVQIDIYAQQISQAASLETALEAVFAASAISNVPLTSQDFYEDSVKAFRVSKDYSIWATN